MIRDILTNKWIIGAAFGLLIVAAGCYWYYEHTTAEYRQQTEQTDKLQQEWKANKAKTPADKEVTQTLSPGEIGEKLAEGKNRVVFHLDELPKRKNELPQTRPVETIKQEETTELVDTGVSPYGFGPYPEVPADFPFPVEWVFPGSDADHELIARVAIKLWTQGIKTMGATMEDGLVYPNYIDTVYIRWTETTDDDDNPIQYISDLGGYPPACLRIVENNIARLGERGAMTDVDIPSDVTVKLYDEAGIDPHAFLNLPK